jgi:hypothetical protein
MSQGRKAKLNYRCPMCFAREIDVDLLYDRMKNEFYCIRCPFVGTKAEILQLNERNKYRYKSGFKRIDGF